MQEATNGVTGIENGPTQGRYSERQQKKLKITASNGIGGFLRISSRTNPKRSVPTKAKLAQLLSMPLDVLFEIFGHLMPLDILHLARTTKDFRNMLTHRSSMSVWKAARLNVPGLPQCPNNMSEPAFANLAFDKHCHNCLATNCPNVDFILRVRYCKRCVKTCLVPIDNFQEKTSTNDAIMRCVPFRHWPNRKQPSCVVKVKDDFLQKIKGLDKEKLSAFVELKGAEMVTFSAHAKRCQSWSDSILDARMMELDKMRQDRKRAIIERLTELGWGDVLEKLPSFHTEDTFHLTLLHEHEHVRPSKPLTDRIWHSIKEDMITYMMEMKDWVCLMERIKLLQQRRELAVQILRTYKLENPSNDIFPGPPDFWRWDRVALLIDSPTDITIDAKSFSGVREKIPEWIDLWRRDRLRDIVFHGLHDDLPWPRTPDAQCIRGKLASCVFTCSKGLCGPRQSPSININNDYRGMWYPEYLHHVCNRIRIIDWSDPFWKKMDGEDPENCALSLGDGYHLNTQRSAWSCDGLRFDKKASRCVGKIVRACGWKAEIMTVEELDRRDPRVICLKCSFGHKVDGERRVKVLAWRKAVQHCMKTHWGDSTVEWQKISDEDASAAKILEQRQVTVNDATWRCVRCLDAPLEPDRMNWEKLRLHLDHRHGIEDHEMEETVHYVGALDCPPRQPETVIMIPRAVV